MTFDMSFCVKGGWAPRDQTPADLAPRYKEMITRLQAIDAVFSRWSVEAPPNRLRPLSTSLDAIVETIEAGVALDDGKPEPRHGYSLVAVNSAEVNPGPRHFELRMHADPKWKFAQNSLSLATPYEVVPDPDVVTFRLFRSAVLALSEPFGLTHADAWPSALTDFWKRWPDMPRLPISWISYIGPRYAHLVTPPASALVERRPDGGLLMAATDETFSVDNPAHMAVAREIEAAVAPFNALPRPLQDVEPG